MDNLTRGRIMPVPDLSPSEFQWPRFSFPTSLTKSPSPPPVFFLPLFFLFLRLFRNFNCIVYLLLTYVFFFFFFSSLFFSHFYEWITIFLVLFLLKGTIPSFPPVFFGSTCDYRDMLSTSRTPETLFLCFVPFFLEGF